MFSLLYISKVRIISRAKHTDTRTESDTVKLSLLKLGLLLILCSRNQGSSWNNFHFLILVNPMARCALPSQSLWGREIYRCYPIIAVGKPGK